MIFLSDVGCVVLQTSAVRAQVHSNGQMTGDQADAREARRSLLRKTASESTAPDEEQDTVAGVSVGSCRSVSTCWCQHALVSADVLLSVHIVVSASVSVSTCVIVMTSAHVLVSAHAVVSAHVLMSACTSVGTCSSVSTRVNVGMH